MRFRDVLQCQADIPEDSGEQIVEIVRNSAGQHAETLQLGALPHRFLQTLAFTNLTQHAHKNMFVGLPVFAERNLQRDLMPAAMLSCKSKRLPANLPFA